MSNLQNLDSDANCNQQRQLIKKITINQLQKSSIFNTWGKSQDNRALEEILQENLLRYQQELAQRENYKNYILGISKFEFDKKQKQWIITFNCSENAKSLFELKLDTLDEKIYVFNQLIKLSEFLQKNEIVHNNIKSTNIIFDNNQLYITDFGYLQPENNNSSIFQDCLNFQQTIGSIQLRQIYTYQQTDLLYNLSITEQTKMLDLFKKKDKDKVIKQDQHALAVIMLEIFYTFPNITTITDYIAQSKNRGFQISNIKQFNQEIPNNKLLIIQQILKERFDLQNHLFPDFPRTLSIFDYKLNQEALLNQQYLDIAKQYLIDYSDEFDLNLLYFLSYKEINTLYLNISKIKLEATQTSIKEEIKRIFAMFSRIDKIKLSESFEYFSKLKQQNINDLFIYLHYLDEKIEDLDISINQDQDKVTQAFLKHYALKAKLKQFYEEINNTSQDQFKFNNINIVKNSIPLPFKQLNQSSLDSLDLLKILDDNFDDPYLKLYFKLNTLIRQKLYQPLINYQLFTNIYDPNFIYVGKITQKNFQGEILTIKTKNKNQIIKHYVNVQTNLEQINISGDQSQIFYYKFEKTPEQFRKIKEYIGEIKGGKYDGKGEQRNFIKNVLYDGTWVESKFQEGKKQLINTENLNLGDPYIWKGNFNQSKQDVEKIMTYFFYYDKQVYSEGKYINDKQVGVHIYYEKQKENKKNELMRIFYFQIFGKNFQIKYKVKQ